MKAFICFQSRAGLPKLRIRVWALALGLALALAPQPARAQLTEHERKCIDYCSSLCKDSHGLQDYGCYEFRCMRPCLAEEKPKPFGAIAFGTRGAEGIAWGKEKQEEADRDAIATCNKYGTNCSVVFRYQYTCAALAVTPDQQHCESATGYSEKNAQDNAVRVCQKTWGKCLTNMSACSAQGSGKAFPPPPARDVSWGAIAYSSADMGAGWSQSKDDRTAAEREAMTACSQRGKACSLQTAFNKQCGALAADRNFTGWGVAADQRDAQNRAIQECAKAGGSRCVLHISFCSY